VTRWCRTKKKDASRWRARSATRAAAGSLELIRRRRYLLLRRAPCWGSWSSEASPPSAHDGTLGLTTASI
jgi:hypothetical protein